MNTGRHRKTFAALILGTWLFALFVGVANACLPEPASAAQTAGMAMHDGDASRSSDCEQFCNDNTPLFGKVQLVQDQPASQPLLVAHVSTFLLPAPAPALTVARLAHPPPDVPILLRSLRLAL